MPFFYFSQIISRKIAQNLKWPSLSHFWSEWTEILHGCSPRQTASIDQRILKIKIFHFPFLFGSQRHPLLMQYTSYLFFAYFSVTWLEQPRRNFTTAAYFSFWVNLWKSFHFQTISRFQNVLGFTIQRSVIFFTSNWT